MHFFSISRNFWFVFLHLVTGPDKINIYPLKPVQRYEQYCGLVILKRLWRATGILVAFLSETGSSVEGARKKVRSADNRERHTIIECSHR